MRKFHLYILICMFLSLIAAPSAFAQCPCSVWNPSATPGLADGGDGTPGEYGVKIRSDVDGFITGVRFYKSAANTGSHVGNLWSVTGNLLATANFVGETPSGWQQVNFSSPVAITANTTYIVSYYAPSGHYSFDVNYFGSVSTDNGPLHALANGTDGPNAVYNYGPVTTFPTSSFSSSNYWVDVVFNTTNAPNVSAFSPTGSGVAVSSAVSATFTVALDSNTVNSSTFQLLDPNSVPVAASVTYNGGTQVATLQPSSALSASTTYTAVVTGGAGGVVGLNGTPMAANYAWSFTTASPPPPPPTCPCSLWSLGAVPGTVDSGDFNAGEYGVKFKADVNGSITGIRFYKSSANLGTHVGNLWSSTGQLLASATFGSESNSGWQQVTFNTPVFVSAGTTYVASYYTSKGHYAFDANFFGNGLDTAPLHAIANSSSANGVYSYSASSTFPVNSFNASNYWVDVVFIAANSNPQPAVTSTTPASGASAVSIGTTVNANFNEPIDSTTLNSSSMLLVDSSGNAIQGVITYISATATASFKPSIGLVPFTTYTATIKSTVKDSFGNSLGSDYSWSFTTGGPPAGSGPGGPILVISSLSNPFSQYYDEILRTEGMNEFAVQDISGVTASTLSFYRIVILGDFQLTSGQVSMLSTWVSAGGNLIAMHPDKQLAGMLGLTPTSGTMSDAYLLVDTSSGPGVGIVNQTIQYHGSADLYSLSSATKIASLYSNANTATPYPAVTMSTFGAGQVAAFTYDLARSVVYTRQGNPAWAGQERIGLAPIRASDMFYGNAPGDPKPNWIDTSKVQIPQADEQQRLLVNMIQQMTFTGGPMGRLWYLPSGFKAAVIMTGDDHNQGGTVARFDAYIANSTPNCSVADWQCVRGTSYIWNGTPITDAQAAFYVNQGFEIALHGDSNPTCSNWNPTQLDSDFTILLQTFAANWPSVPAPNTHRMHCISWPDYDSMSAIELAHGMRLDTNYYWFPDVFVQGLTGMFTGSGMAMRFTDLNGNTRDVYQATTQLPDEDNWNWPNDIDILLDNALGPQGYYGIFTANMHTDILDSPGSVAIVASAQARGIPIVTSRQMLTWLDGRNSSSFGSLTWNGTTLGFDMVVGAGARNLQAMLPLNSVGGALTSISRSGTAVPFTTQTIKGLQYAFFAATAGSYQAVYGGSGGGTFSISGTISGAGGASAQLTLSGAASGTTTADGGGNYTFGGLANGSYTVTPSKAGFTFTPTSTNVTISGSNRNSINFTSATQTYSISGSISGTGGSGATVALTGAATQTTTADGSGNYSFSSLLNGNYTVTPTRTGFTFSPASQSTTVNNANVTGLNFTSAVAVSLSSVAMNPTTVLGGTSSTGTVTLSGPAPSGGIVVTLSDNSTSATTPASVTVSSGSTTATFTVTTTGVSSQTTVTISATYSGTTKQATLTITAPTLSSVTLNPTSVVGGNSSTGTVTISGPAPSGGTVVTLSDNSSSATTPTSVTVTSGNKTATFTITTSGVSSTTTITVTASFAGVNKTATLTLTKAALTTLTLSPNNVNGGQSSTGTVTLNGNAPSGGATVTLSSSNFIVAQVPVSVTIPSGSKTANFTVTTTRRLTGTITISGTYSGVTARGTLTVR